MDQLVQAFTTSAISIIAVVGTFAIAAYQITHGQSVNIPDIISLLVGAVVGLYFGHSSATNGARQAGAAAAQSAVDQIAHNANAGSTTTNP